MMRTKNDTRKIEIYNYINDYIMENGYSPSLMEIAEHFQCVKSAASKYVSRLEAEGYVERIGRNRLVTHKNPTRYNKMPIVGDIACGKPILAVEDIEGYIPYDEAFLGEGEFFALRAKGDSMINKGINHGDIVCVKKQDTADDGDIVVAMIEDDCTNEEYATLKTFYRDEKNKCYILHPENDALQDIIVTKLRILGIGVKLIKNLK